MRKAFLAVALSTLSIGLLSPAPARAQFRSDTRGFYAGVALDGDAITYEGDNKAESGGGAGLAVGWGLTNFLTLYVEGAAARLETLDGLDTYTLAHFDLAARFNLLSRGSRLRPYGVIGISGVAAAMEIAGNLFTLSGGGPTFGLGLAYFLSRKLALDVGLKATGVGFTKAEYAGASTDVDVSATSGRFSLGMKYWSGGH